MKYENVLYAYCNELLAHKRTENSEHNKAEAKRKKTNREFELKSFEYNIQNDILAFYFQSHFK